MVTTTVNEFPLQPPVVGVTVYVADFVMFVTLVSVPLMFVEFVSAAPPNTLPVVLGIPQL